MASKKSKIKKIIFFLRIGFVFMVLGILSVIGVFAYYAKDLPSPANIQQLKIAESTKIYDRTGTVLLYEIHGEQKRTIISLEQASKYVKFATIVAEDDDFYRHFGIDFRAIARALLANIKGKTVRQGGSTITQQLIKNIYLSPERTITRKIKEIILTLEMELKYSKDEILSFYLNAVPYGSNAYGVEAASQTFFGKRANDLTLAEAALLASLPKAPTHYSPFGNNPEVLERRKDYILDRMYNFGYITEHERDEAKGQTITYTDQSRGILAPHFVMHVREYLERTYGEDQLRSLGLTVITTLDWTLQREAEKIIKETGEINEKRFRAKNAALVAIDPTNGHILTMVGSRDYFDRENDGNVNVATRMRQPGSSFKPFAYARAFEKGYTPDTIIFDVETNFGVQGAEEYIPGNYTEKFVGPITLKEALAQSINIPAVKTLYLAGVQDTIKLAKKMGIGGLNDPSRYGLSLVLGGGEVTLLDETSAYGVFAQDGVLHPPTAIISITSSVGEVLEKYQEETREVLAPQIARLITSILADSSLRAPVFGHNSPLNLQDIPAAAKTGTTQKYRDAWAIGYTPQIVVGVWVGNNDNSEMKKAPGADAAAPIWNVFMKKVYEITGWEIKEFPKPEPIKTSKPVLNGELEGITTLPIDIISGKISSEYTPPELVQNTLFFSPHSLLYYIQKDDPLGDPPSRPEQDPQFALWEEGVQKWARDKQTAETAQNATSTTLVMGRSDLRFSLPPQEYDDIHTPENMPSISFLSPLPGERFVLGNTILINFSIKNNFPVQKIELSFEGSRIHTISNLSVQNREYSIPLFLPLSLYDDWGKKSSYTISVRVFDVVMNKSEASTKIEIQ